MKKHSRERGSAVTQTVLMAAVLIFIIMPVFSAVIEKYILMEKARVITDSVDMTNISAYNALSSAELGKVRIGAERSDILEIYRHILSINLRLNDDLEPQPDSVAEGCVEVLSLEIFSSDFPAHCPEGGTNNQACCPQHHPCARQAVALQRHHPRNAGQGVCRHNSAC